MFKANLYFTDEKLSHYISLKEKVNSLGEHRKWGIICFKFPYTEPLMGNSKIYQGSKTYESQGWVFYKEADSVAGSALITVGGNKAFLLCPFPAQVPGISSQVAWTHTVCLL